MENSVSRPGFRTQMTNPIILHQPLCQCALNFMALSAGVPQNLHGLMAMTTGCFGVPPWLDGNLHTDKSTSANSRIKVLISWSAPDYFPAADAEFASPSPAILKHVPCWGPIRIWGNISNKHGISRLSKIHQSSNHLPFTIPICPTVYHQIQ